ncbi:amidase (plasmid) [Haloferacaceae archaeon DSL9]
MATNDVDILETTIDEIHEAFESGTLTSAALVERYLDRIRAYDRAGPELNSIITVNPNAKDEAAELDRRYDEEGAFVGPLHGVPVLVKDQAETEGITTTFGSVAFEEYVPEADATAVAALREAGAIVLAKTNLPDWATSWFAYSSALGRTKNPYALDRDPGGSSSGTGAAVAANLGAVGIGEDTGGSIRLPASFNNLFGIRVTPGLISRTGMSPLVNSQDTAGPMARTVTDIARLLDVLVGYDSADPFTVANELARVDGTYLDHADRNGAEGARIGVLRSAFGSDGDEEAAPVNDRVADAIEAFRDVGAEIVDPVEIADLDAHLEKTSLYLLQSKRDLNAFFAAREDAPVDSVDALVESGSYHELLDLLEGIADGPTDPESDPEYWEKVAAQEIFKRAILTTYAEHDLDAILCPDVQVLPPKADEIESGAIGTLTFPTNTLIASQSGCCAISCPTGLTDDGIPVGVELIGKPFDEPTLLGLASAYEQRAEPRSPPETAPPLSE